jgi:tetratricopeptide (TPR) repeat protein
MHRPRSPAIPVPGIADNNLGWLLATCPDERYRDGKQALENAGKACQLVGGKNWHYIDTLAAAYAESGNFQKAKEWHAKAIELAATDKTVTDKDKKEMRDRLELYTQGKPYREEAKKKQ